MRLAEIVCRSCGTDVSVEREDWRQAGDILVKGWEAANRSRHCPRICALAVTEITQRD